MSIFTVQVYPAFRVHVHFHVRVHVPCELPGWTRQGHEHKMKMDTGTHKTQPGREHFKNFTSGNLVPDRGQGGCEIRLLEPGYSQRETYL
jgi:hypothetical protein